MAAGFGGGNQFMVCTSVALSYLYSLMLIYPLPILPLPVTHASTLLKLALKECRLSTLNSSTHGIYSRQALIPTPPFE